MTHYHTLHYILMIFYSLNNITLSKGQIFYNIITVSALLDAPGFQK